MPTRGSSRGSARWRRRDGRPGSAAPTTAAPAPVAGGQPLSVGASTPSRLQRPNRRGAVRRPRPLAALSSRRPTRAASLLPGSIGTSRALPRGRRSRTPSRAAPRLPFPVSPWLPPCPALRVTGRARPRSSRCPSRRAHAPRTATLVRGSPSSSPPRTTRRLRSFPPCVTRRRCGFTQSPPQRVFGFGSEPTRARRWRSRDPASRSCSSSIAGRRKSGRACSRSCATDARSSRRPMLP